MTPDRTRPAARGLVALIATGIAVSAVMLYLVLGFPKAGDPDPVTTLPGADGASHMAPENIEGMVDRLAKRLENQPDDGRGWLMLARSYAALGRFGESARAYGRAIAVLPPAADILADYADVLAVTQGRRLAGEPEKLVQRALAVDPKHAKALALAGTAAFERSEFAKALAYWRKAIDSAPADAEFTESLRRSVADAESHLASAARPAR